MPTSAPTQPREPQAAVVLLIIVNCAVEAVLQLADYRLIGSPYWRSWTYDNFAFYAPLLRDWQPNYPLQPVAMFVTYAFLHAGWLHLLVNMLALSSFGTEIARQAGTQKFLAAYLLTAIGGAACYGALSDSPTPMVGASGALFGLLGVWICWGYLERRHYGEGMREIWRALFILVAYNVVFYVLLHGQLAWETHLGGFLTGWALAMFWGRPIYRRKSRA
ncbi:rhomboid family intramembrane serine protease [Mangrovicoccus sp. HB161399]|uniref:rhomboid family intramembrane serine protease n=1 Tax=Mangrovicoccus sp. HB161399 TaxID=2720392 RepID=UPI001556F482|nr:rhomboid family intramembrane serine protease [Mangrovicoccus sp. HB161399]